MKSSSHKHVYGFSTCLECYCTSRRALSSVPGAEEKQISEDSLRTETSFTHTHYASMRFSFFFFFFLTKGHKLWQSFLQNKLSHINILARSRSGFSKVFSFRILNSGSTSKSPTHQITDVFMTQPNPQLINEKARSCWAKFSSILIVYRKDKQDVSVCT